MPFCGRKFNGSGYIGSRWSSFLDLSHGRNIRHTSTHTHTHRQTHTYPTLLNFFTRFTVRWRQRDRTGKCLFAWDLRHQGFIFFLCFFSVFSLSLAGHVCVSPKPQCHLYFSFWLPVFKILTVPWWIFKMLELQADKFGVKLLKKGHGEK